MISDINKSVLPPGSKLGSERSLAEHYQVSRSTLRHVLTSLESAGLVQRIPGRAGGTFISHAKVDRDLTGIVGVPAYLARQGYSTGSRVLSTQMVNAGDDACNAFGISHDEFVIDIRRVRLADHTPISLEHAQFPASRFAGLMECSLGGSIYELLSERFGVVIGEAHEVIEVVNATSAESEMLSIEDGAPLLSVSRITDDADGHSFELSYDLFRADRTTISVRAAGPGLSNLAQPNGEHIEFRFGDV